MNCLYTSQNLRKVETFIRAAEAFALIAATLQGNYIVKQLHALEYTEED